MKAPLLITILFLTIQVLLQADVRYVSKTGSSEPPYLTWETASDSIQKCLDICDNGDTVYVGNGVYTESLIINKATWLLGSSMDSTIIDGTGLENFTIFASGEAAFFNIANLTVIGKAFNNGCAIYTDCTLNISSCKITNSGTGLSSLGGTIDKIIISNSSNGFYGGCFTDTCFYKISNSIILLKEYLAIGINTSIGGNFNIENNLILYYGPLGHNDPLAGVYAGWPHRITITNNLISGFSDGIFLDVVEDSAFIINNTIVYSRSAGISPGDFKQLMRNNFFVNNNYGIWSRSSQGTLNTSDYNIFWNSKWGQDIKGDIAFGPHDRIVDPMFMRDTIAGPLFNFDFHLQEFSPGMNQGDPLILNKDLKRSDVGMFGGPLSETYDHKNLSPRPPRNLTATVDSAKVTLKWSKNTEADTAYYNIYRDTIPNFTTDTTKLISRQRANEYTEALPKTLKRIYYKLTAEDTEGNLSGPSEEKVITYTSAEDDYTVIEEYKLFQNYPNPFNPSTIIAYRLKEMGFVKLLVYDIKGEQIRVLVNKEQDQGYYEEKFDGADLSSGVYLYRIEVTGKGNIPVYSDMKKSILIK